MITEQIKCLKEKHHYLEKQQLIIEEDLYYDRNAFVRDSMLYLAGAISLSDYEKARQSFIAKKNNLENLNALISNSHLSQIQLEQQLYELSTQRTSDDAVFRSRINKAIRSLDSQIALWKERYAIISPYNGTVSLQNVWSSGQYVADGDVIASIKPSIKSITMGRARVPSYSFGKVKVGQDVIIKLSGFPYMEFGILKGSVKSISPVPIITSDGIYYTIDVSLPYGLESSYHKELPFIQNMDGSAEIITEDMSVIEQFIRPIRSLFVNR
ncbi:MAG: HlyD family efflux transporter periplasmic adaptor subunit [Bacteroidales bacterium]|nr:HlyD family efflux transporter periplasmic adaptor subunit [Bacteroidales bacterium]